MSVPLDTTIYAVWGPTAEWGDGSGPLGYFLDKASAEGYIADEKAMYVDMAYQLPEEYRREEGISDPPDSDDAETLYEWSTKVNGWPSNIVGFWVEENPLVYYAKINGNDLPLGSEDELMEFLNGG